MSDPTRLDKVRGALWGLAVGNVLGLSTESMSRTEARRWLGESGPLKQLPLEERERPWDDDLAMSMELTEWLVNGYPDAQALLERYARWSQMNGRGIGLHTRVVLQSVLRGHSRVSERIYEARLRDGHPPRGNGSLMRVAPIGLRFSNELPTLMRIADLDASLTHWDPICRQASVFQALWIAGYIRNEADPFSWARRKLPEPLDPDLEATLHPRTLSEIATKDIDGPGMGFVLLTLGLAASLLASDLNFQEALLWTLRMGGDTDTNGAVVGALLGARDGFQVIPDAWKACVSHAELLDEAAESLLEDRP